MVKSEDLPNVKPLYLKLWVIVKYKPHTHKNDTVSPNFIVLIQWKNYANKMWIKLTFNAKTTKLNKSMGKLMKTYHKKLKVLINIDM